MRCRLPALLAVLGLPLAAAPLAADSPSPAETPAHGAQPAAMQPAATQPAAEPRLPLKPEAVELRADLLVDSAVKLWLRAQNLHRDVATLEPEHFDEAIEAFSRAGFARDPKTGDHLVFLTGRLDYIPVEVLESGAPPGFTMADPGRAIRVTEAEVAARRADPEMRAALATLRDQAPADLLRAELSPAGRERLAELVALLDLVAVRQAARSAAKSGADAIGAAELVAGARLIIHYTAIDGWSRGYDYPARAHALALNAIHSRIERLQRAYGRHDEKKRLALATDLAGLEVAPDAWQRLEEILAADARAAWRRAQATVPVERLFIRYGEARAAASAALPRRASETEVVFFPETPDPVTVDGFDLEVLRESALHWQIIERVLWRHGRYADGEDPDRDLLAVETRAAFEIAELVAQEALLLLTTAGEAARAAGETRLTAERIEAARDALGARLDGAPPARVAAADEPPAWDGPDPVFVELGPDETGIAPIDDPHTTDRRGAGDPPLMAHDAFRGVATADVDRDGLPDLFIAEEWGRSRLYRNAGGGRFEDRTEAAGLAGIPRVSGGYFADHDNDGCVDLLVLRNHLSSLLYRNRCDGTFEDVTRAAGLFREGVPATGAVWLDYDNDGWLDLYLTLTGDFTRGYVPARGDAENALPNLLWRNEGPGPDGRVTFVDVTERSGAGNRGLSLAAAAVDFDNDGDQDLYVANDMQRNALLENLGDGRFRDVARAAGVDDLGNGMGVSVGDVDQDGWMDLYVTNIGAIRNPRARIPPQSNRLYRNRGDGSGGDGIVFEDRHEKDFGDVATGWGWNSFFFDFDNDGHLDVYVINGFRPEYLPHNYQRNLLFRRDPASGRYVRFSARSEADFEGYSRGGIFFDPDRDGDLDLVVTGLHSPRFFKNRSEALGHRWLAVELVGTRSNRDGFGARVAVTAGGRTQRAEMGNQGGGFISSIHGPLHFGLGNAERVERIEVRWPSGVVQTVEDVAVDQKILLSEPDPD